MEKKKYQLKITIYGYDVITTEEAAKLVTGQLRQLKLIFSGPTPLPTERKIITVPISPHKHKDSQEQFIQETHRRVLHIPNISPSNLKSLESLKVPNTASFRLKTSF